MPIPMPTEGESNDKFMSRCMGSEVMKREFPEQKQRVAVCMSQWRKKHKGKESDKKTEKKDKE